MNAKQRIRTQRRAGLGAAALFATGIAFAAHAQTVASVTAPHLEYVFEETVLLGQGVPVGPTPWGTRNIVPIIGGTFSGPGNGSGLKGTIVPGGWDWQLVHVNGCASLKADYMLKTDDGVIINVINTGTLCGPREGEKPIASFTTPVFEAPIGKYDWLGRSAFIGTLEGASVDGKPAVRIRFYRAQ